MRCEPNAVTSQYGSNIFSLSPLPEEFAFWAKEQGADVNFKDYYGNTPIFYQASMRGGNVQLFDVQPTAEIVIHDGVSPIHIPNQIGSEAFRWLWNYLVPPKGKAQTAQGEVIRIAGKVNNQIVANGGANWDNDYRKMLRVFVEYLRLGNPLKDKDIAQAKDQSAYETAVPLYLRQLIFEHLFKTCARRYSYRSRFSSFAKCTSLNCSGQLP